MQEIEIINVMISNFVSLILHFFEHIHMYNATYGKTQETICYDTQT